MSTAKSPTTVKEIKNLNLQHPTYWSRSPNTWGSLSDWDIYFVDQIPGCSKEEAHRSLSIELNTLLSKLPKSSRRFTKANALKRALEREIQSIATREEIGRAEERILDNKLEKRKKKSKVEEEVIPMILMIEMNEKRQRLTSQKSASFMNLITDFEYYRIDDKSNTQENLENSEKNEEDIQDNEQTPSVASSTAKTDVESNQKSLKDLLCSNLQCSENMKSICQHHDTLYPDENSIDLRPNSNYFKKLPFKLLELYLKDLDNKIENLIPPNIHKVLIEFFQQDLTGEEWHIKIDDLCCLDQSDWLMVSVIRILRRTLPPFIMAFSMGARNPLLNLATLEKPHLNSFVHPCLQASLWYISAICYEFGEIGSKNHIKRECADGVGYLKAADKFQLVYMEGSKPNANGDKEILDASKISYNLQNIFIKIVKDNIKCRRRFPKTLAVFGGQSFRLRIHLQFLNYCGKPCMFDLYYYNTLLTNDVLTLEGKFFLNEVDNANLPRDFTEMADFVFFYECMIKWALLAREVKEGFEESRSQQRPSRLSYINSLNVANTI
ncbi:3491_t:CDS:2 [Funneliformis geosporum]|nr:3491_t:CDS:2 [Funneliformis geosporum]